MNPREIYDYLVQSGLQPHQAAGVIGNLAQESNFDPRARNPDSGAYGLFQHLGPRLTALNDYARRTGRPVDDPRTQLDFTIGELNGPESRARGMLMNARTPEEATLAFSHGFERAGRNERNDNRRIGKAKEFLNYVMGKYGMPALNAVIPAAQAEEAPPPEDVDFDEFTGGQESAPLEVDFDEFVGHEPEAPKAEEGMIDRLNNSPEMKQAARVGAKAITTPLSFANTLVNLPSNAAVLAYNNAKNQMINIVPGLSPIEDIPYAENQVDTAVNDYLKSAGISPEPTGMGERAVTMGLGVLTGAGVGKAAIDVGKHFSVPALQTLGGFFGANAARQAAGAATSSLAGDLAHEAGAPGWVETGARIAGGMGGSSLMGVAEGVGRGVKRAGQAMTEAGREKIAGRILKRTHTAPEEAVRRYEDPALNKPIIAGSNPYAAEVSQDPGAAFGLRALESSDIGRKASVGDMVNVRIGEVDDAIYKLLDKANQVPGKGQEDILKKLDRIKTLAYDKFAAGKTLDSVPIDMQPLAAQFDRLYRQYQGNSNITNALKRVEDALLTGPRTVGNAGVTDAPNFQRVWNARKELDNAIYEKWKDSDTATKAELARVGEELRPHMNKALIDADPDFEPFLRRYHFAMKKEDKIKLGRELVKKMRNASRNAPQPGEVLGSRKLSVAKFNTLEDDLRDVGDELTPLGERLSKRQLDAFDTAIKERQRAAWLTDGGGRVGSPTTPYLAEGKLLADDIAAGFIGDKNGKEGLGRTLLEFLGRPADFALKQAEPKIARIMAKAYADPAEMARLLKKADNFPQVTLRRSLEDAARAGALGELYTRLGR